MSLLFNILSRLVIDFSSKKYILISWLQSPFAVILEPQKIKSMLILGQLIPKSYRRVLTIKDQKGKEKKASAGNCFH